MSDTQPDKWDETVDVLVVGAGAGAMTAAITAHDQGASTLLVEKSERYGGSSAMSGGALWIPCNHLMGDAGVEDTEEDAYTYFKACSKGQISEARMRAYLDNAPRMVRYLTEHTQLDVEAMPEYGDYYPMAPGSRPGGRTMEPKRFDGRVLGEEIKNLRDQGLQCLMMGRLSMTAHEARMLLTRAPGWLQVTMGLFFRYIADLPWRFQSKRDRSLTMGNALAGSLRASLMDRNIPLWLETPAREILQENGRVVGMEVEREGRPCRIRATKAVILAAGGFEASQAMRDKYLPNPTRAEWTCANPANTGDIINMGIDVGAGLDLMDDAWWGPTTVVPGEDRARMLVIEKSLPGSVLVNKRGERFVNEAAPYVDVVNAMQEKNSAEVETVPCYLIFDARFRRSYPCGPFLPGAQQPDFILSRRLRDEYLIKANTIEGLAQKVGIDPAGLASTIEKVNGYAKTGVDLDFHRGETPFDQYYGDVTVTPNPCLAPIEEPPFYCIISYPGELGTKGGLTVDEKARVLTESGEAIPGLYAIGNCSASVMGRTYMGAGATLGPANTFGFIAAHDALGKEPA